MIDKSFFEETINSNLFGSISNEYGRNYAVLKENDPGATLRKVKVFDISDNTVSLNIDKSSPAETVFKKGMGKRKKCDYVLITEVNSTNYLVFIEMKSNKAIPKREVVKQLKGGECIIDYCGATFGRFHNKNDYFNDFQKRFVCFYRPSISKTPTHPNRKIMALGTNTSPEDMLKYPSPLSPSIKALV